MNLSKGKNSGRHSQQPQPSPSATAKGAGFLRMLGVGWLAIAVLTAVLHAIMKNQFPMIDLCAALLAFGWGVVAAVEGLVDRTTGGDIPR